MTVLKCEISAAPLESYLDDRPIDEAPDDSAASAEFDIVDLLIDVTLAGHSQPQPEPEPEHSLAPRKPRTLGGVVYLAVLGATLLGVAVVVAGRVQVGLSTAGAGLVAGALARLVLPREQAGMLGVRRKLIDVVTMALLGGGLLVVAALIRERVA